MVAGGSVASGLGTPPPCDLLYVKVRAVDWGFVWWTTLLHLLYVKVEKSKLGFVWTFHHLLI